MAKDTWTKLHQDLKLPAEAIAQIAAGTRHERAGQFGVRQLELYHNAEGQVYCLLEAPDEEAIRRHHAALVPCTRSGLGGRVTTRVIRQGWLGELPKALGYAGYQVGLVT